MIGRAQVSDRGQMLAPSVSSMRAGGNENRGSGIAGREGDISADPAAPDPRSPIPDPRSPIPDPRSSIRPIEQEHRAAIEALLRATRSFRENEIKVALEVIDTYLIHPEEDYAALGAFTPGGELLGYVCYGPTPCTVGTWDLYWIAVTPAAQGTGVGTMLLQEVERRLGRADARLVIIETSSLPSYTGSREFYQRRGYEVVARVPDFYAQGDDRLIFAKRIHN